MTTASQRELGEPRGENYARSRTWPRELVSSSSLGSFCMAPLGDAATAAHTALWAARHGGRVLGQERVQQKLTAYFAGRGEAVIDLPVDVDVSDKEVVHGCVRGCVPRVFRRVVSRKTQSG
eukprot:5028679-Prymnesium_polylepis.3